MASHPKRRSREKALEECGLVMRVGACLSRLVQFVVTAEGLGVEKRSAFFAARIERENRAAMLPGRETLWLGPARAAQILKHDSQMWAVRNWMKLRGAPRRGGLS
jgi:hypothetical protein